MRERVAYEIHSHSGTYRVLTIRGGGSRYFLSVSRGRTKKVAKKPPFYNLRLRHEDLILMKKGINGVMSVQTID